MNTCLLEQVEARERLRDAVGGQDPKNLGLRNDPILGIPGVTGFCMRVGHSIYTCRETFRPWPRPFAPLILA